MYPKYWDEERETMSPEKRDALILERVKEQLAYVYNKLPFYRKLYDRHNFKPTDVKTLEDFTTKVPIVTKDMLRQDQEANPVYGSYAGIDPKENVYIHGSSGTTGNPTLYAYSKSDWDRIVETHAMCQWALGIRPNDIVQIAFPFGMFLGGWGVKIGAEKLGATVFPIGNATTLRQLEMLERVGSTVFTSTPSYALRMVEVAREQGKDLVSLPVKRGAFGGEPGAGNPGVKAAIGQGWGIAVHDIASTSEMHPVWTNVECEALQGMHCYTDEVYTEIVDKHDANIPVPMGETGAIVYTHLWRNSQPMIRFWPGDESYLTDEPCSCGRTYPRMPEGVIGRLDDMLIIRGANVYPSAVESVIRSIQECGVEFRIVLKKRKHMDEATLQVEYNPETIPVDSEDKETKFDLLSNKLRKKLKESLGLRIEVDVLEPRTLERFELKAKRVIDNR